MKNGNTLKSLKSGAILSTGYGFITNEFNGDTWFEIGKIISEELRSIEGYYTFDETQDLVDRFNGNIIGQLAELDYDNHPDDNSFVLIPKSDIISTYYH